MGKELIVPLAVVGILASMLLPVPPGIMDFLLVGNLILALVLLMSTLYLSDSLKLSSLPSMLLLATMYRLALNISTTRNILSTGEAGRVVEAFGNIVIQGNFVVGAVIFLIITLVQFLVIAKGSERVAEVSARFTLDALPGKQMSIDADVRAGLIDFSVARTKRQDLQTESRFYGALDGAMKFIKGDAIAGMIITAINIVGGLAIGLIGEGLDLRTAVAKYTLLTVGDGLVAQVPALLNSLAAGIVVTKVCRGDDVSLARDLINQLGQLRSVKILIGVFAVIFGCIPGMPALPFLSLATLLLVSAAMNGTAAAGKEPKIISFTPKAVPLLQLELDLEKSKKYFVAGALLSCVEEVRQRSFDDLGLILPFPDVVNVTSQDASIIVRLRGIKVLSVALTENQNENKSKLFSQLTLLIQNHAPDLVDDVLTRRTLDSFDQQFSELVSAVVPGVVSVTQLTEVLRGLLKEQISIKNFDVILQAIAENGPKASSERALLEQVRIALKWIVTEKYAQDRVISAIVIDAISDLNLSRCERERDKNYDVTPIIEGVLMMINQNSEAKVVVVSSGARRILREHLMMRGVNFPVVAFEELVDGFTLKVTKQLELSADMNNNLIDRLAA